MGANRRGNAFTTRGWALLSAFLLSPASAHAQSDWIEELPDVLAVARAAIAEYGAEVAPAPADETWAAANVAATFKVLREIIWLKQQHEWFMAGDREQALREVVAAYQEAELAIGNAWIGRVRRGARPSPAEHCRDEVCYLGVFQIAINSRSSSASYRERVLQRLFPCSELAAQLNQLRQDASSQSLSIPLFHSSLPYLPSPAHTLAVEAEYAGLATPQCDATSGGDSDGDGLCDAWEIRSDEAETLRADGRPACIRLTKVRLAPDGGLVVSIAEESLVEPGMSVRFRVTRSETEASSGGDEIWWRYARVCDRGNPIDTACPEIVDRDTASLLYAVVAYGTPISPDPAPGSASGSPQLPFISVEATSIPSTGPVHCEQALQSWLPRHLQARSGLHGPDDDWLDAAKGDQPARLALLMTDEPGFGFDVEHGYLIVRKGNAGYYTTPPMRSTQGLFSFIRKKGQPLLLPEDYYASFERAFEGSCENKSEFHVVASVHTHPRQLPQPPDDFSLTDYDGAIPMLQSGPAKWPWGEDRPLPTDLQAIVMLNVNDLCVRVFVLPPRFTVPSPALDEDARVAAFSAGISAWPHGLNATGRCNPPPPVTR